MIEVTGLLERHYYVNKKYFIESDDHGFYNGQCKVVQCEMYLLFHGYYIDSILEGEQIAYPENEKYRFAPK